MNIKQRLRKFCKGKKLTTNESFILALVEQILEKELPEIEAHAYKKGIADYFIKTYYEECGKKPSQAEIESAISSL